MSKNDVNNIFLMMAFLVLLLLTFLQESKCANDFFIAIKHDEVEKYKCVTNSKFALSWIPDDSDKSSKEVSISIPKLDKIFDDNINKETRMQYDKNIWQIRETLNSVILDRRWEEIDTFETNSSIQYKTLEINQIDFDIAISLRGSKEFDILLCNGNGISSRCYWFMVSTTHGCKIQKCNMENFKQQRFNADDNSLTTSEYECNATRILNNNWSHFKIRKKAHKLSFIHMIQSEPSVLTEKFLLEASDTRDFINVTNILFHSQDHQAPVFWKIHKMEYIYTKEKITGTNLGPRISSTRASVCISMFLSMCNMCSLNITLKRLYDNSFVKENTYNTANTEWKDITFTVNNLSNSIQYQLSVSTISEDDITSFWAIDSVRQCQDNKEFRMIASATRGKCQLMFGEDNTISSSNPTNEYNLTNNCTEDTVGEFCVPCKWIFENNDCEKTKICSKKGCSCSAGFKMSEKNNNCDQTCDSGFYGQNCQKECRSCFQSSCNHINGSCFQCPRNYQGERCEIPPATFFKKPPRVTNITFTEATISVDKEIQVYQTNDAPLSFAVYYKKAEEINWTLLGNNYKVSEVNSVKVSQLEPDTTYSVKCVITTENNQTYNNDYILIANFTTNCQHLSQNDFYIKPSNSSVYIFFNKKIDFMCKYKVSISNNTYSTQRTIKKSNDTLIEDLIPPSQYNITIESRYWKMEESFNTNGIIPEKVRNLTITDLSSTSVRIYWERPITISLNDSSVKGYNVEYQRISSYMCDKSDFSENMALPQILPETTLSTNISNLTPYSRYKFSVYAVTSTNINGQKNILNHTTLASNAIKRNEIAEILNVTAKANTAEVGLFEIDCNKIRGPIIINMMLICRNEWCRNETTMFEKGTDSFISLQNLTAFTNYTLEIKFCRNESCSSIHRKSFQTQPTVCNPVNEFIVYSKNSNSISIRWKAPYPPTGFLKNYEIRHYPLKVYAKPQKHIVPVHKNMSCTLWPDYNCMKLTDLKENENYTISINARNENPTNYSLPAKIEAVTTCKEASDPPYDLKYNWTINNDLELEWKHPNKSNGEIQHFQIEIMMQQHIIKRDALFVSESNYTLIYHFQIEAKFFPLATTYAITIYAYNDLFGKELNATIIRPPDLPSFLENPRFYATNTTISINISIREPQKEWNDYRLIVLIANPDLDNLNSNHPNVVVNCSIENFNITYTVDIGENTKKNFICDQTTTNYLLNPGTHYKISILLINTFKNMTRQNLITYLWQTTGEKLESVKLSPLPLLALLLLVIPTATILFLKKHHLMAFLTKKGSNTSQDDEILLSGLQDNFIVKESKPEEVSSRPIKITDFDKYVRESIESGELERQHALFPHGQTKPWTCGSLIENKTKNRYNNLIAYDHSRVILEQINGDPHSDYINANYIDGYQLQKAYIATQGPKASTLNDFWRMIWQENVQYIVMLANVYEGGKKNVEKYWPSPNAKLQFDNITITHVSSKTHENYEHRTFNLSHHNVTRKLEQLHFLAWPDHGVPLYCQSLVPLLEKMLELPLNSKSPIVVHCSAGVGRTGTILLSHISLKMAESEGYVEVLKNLQNLREQRANLVDNAEQYKLAHLVILECLSSVKTAIPCSEIDRSVRIILENCGVKEQMKQLKDTQWRDEVMKAIGQKGKSVVVVKEKNRFQNIIPEIQGRVALNCFSNQDSYINAVTVDGYRRPGRYIVTQQPLPTTLGDFWRLVEENDVTTIISLNEIDTGDVTSCSIWPSSANPQMEPVDNIALSHIKTLSLACYDLISVQLNGDMSVEILAMKNWPSGTNCPKSTAQFLTFWEDSDAASKKSEKVIVTCYDGAKACGLYVAMSFIIEKIKLEQVCDVYQAVRTVRHNRSQFVEEDQFEFLYRASVDYVNGFQSYADFI